MKFEFRTLVLASLLVAVVVLSGCSQAPSGSTAVPEYGGSKVYSAPTFYYQIIGVPTEGVSVKAYQVENANARDILNWYKSKLSDYEVVEEMSVATVTTPQGSAEWGTILFKKGDKGVGIWAVSGSSIEGGGAVYFIVEGPIDKLIGESGGGAAGSAGEALPASDQASGEEPVKRYPGSVMLSYYKDTSNPLEVTISVDYGTKDSAETVADWYKRELQAQGWQLESESSDDSEIDLAFAKGKEYIDICIIKPYEGVSYTEIDIYYKQEGLPSHDLVSGEEPIERYPGSVMLEYSTVTVGGLKSIQISYGTEDSGNSVFEWYVNKLKGEGWEVMTSTSEGQYYIGGSKGNEGISVEITEETFTKIVVTYTVSS